MTALLRGGSVQARLEDPELAMMHRIDGLHQAPSFAGSRMLRNVLVAKGFAVGLWGGSPDGLSCFCHKAPCD